MTFKDHFSARATGYARARPSYPPTLFEALAKLAPGRDLVWDCGTGNGQAAVGLAEEFARVVATDPSQAQLAQARPHPKITFRLGTEGESGLEAGTADLAAAAQAAHWFDLPTFYQEARRVLRRDGLVAMWCYGLCRVSPEIDRILHRFYFDVVGPFWPSERRHVEDGYRSFDFPFPELPFPVVAMERHWRLDELTAYVATWSAVEGFTTAKGADPVPALHDELAPAWGDDKRLVRWPLSGRVGRSP